MHIIIKRYLIIFFLLLHTYFFAQIKFSGSVSDKYGAIPGIQLVISNSLSTQTDFDGYYQFVVPKDKNINLLFKPYSNYFQIEIIEIDPKKIDGSTLNVILQTHDPISTQEYEALPDLEKQKFSYDVVYCYNGPIAKYYVSNEFRHKFITLFLNNREIKIDNFKFDSKESRIIINANELW